MPQHAQTRRQQLIEARDKVQRQIEILQAGPAYILPFDPSLLPELTKVLGEINENLAALGPNDG